MAGFGGGGNIHNSRAHRKKCYLTHLYQDIAPEVKYFCPGRLKDMKLQFHDPINRENPCQFKMPCITWRASCVWESDMATSRSKIQTHPYTYTQILKRYVSSMP